MFCAYNGKCNWQMAEMDFCCGANHTKNSCDMTSLPQESPWSSDLSKCVIGDLVATLFGWATIKRILYTDGVVYPVEIRMKNGLLHSYTFDGFISKCCEAPSAFTVPPLWLMKILGPKPCPFVKGQAVLVRDFEGQSEMRRYFSHIADDGSYCCFADGTTEWSNHGVNSYKYCKPAEGTE